MVAGGEGDAETSGSWVVVLSRLSARWLALSRAGGAVGCCSPAQMVGGVFPVWQWRACALGWLFFGWGGWYGSRRGAGVVGWFLVVIGSRLFDVPLVWFAVGWFWLLVFPGAWFVLAVDGRARFRCVVVWLSDSPAWLDCRGGRVAAARCSPACSIPWLIGGRAPGVAVAGALMRGWGGFGVDALYPFLSGFVV